MFKWTYLQHSCPLENSWGKIWIQENRVEVVLKRKLQFLDSTKVWITAICPGKNRFASQYSVCA